MEISWDLHLKSLEVKKGWQSLMMQKVIHRKLKELMKLENEFPSNQRRDDAGQNH